MKTIFEIIQERLAQLNKKNNWLADKIGTSPQNINNWRVRGVPPKEVARVAQALGLDRDALENGELLLSINEKSLNGNKIDFYLSLTDRFIHLITDSSSKVCIISSI